MEPSPTTVPRPPEVGKSAAPLALALVLLLPAGLLAQAASPLAGLLWTEPFVFLVPAVVAAAGSNLEPRAWLRLRPAPGAALATAVAVGAGGWFLGAALYAAVRSLAPASLVARYDLARIFQGPLSEQLGFAVAATFVAPLCEEVAFRGGLASAFHSRHGPTYSIGATGLLFALLHLDPLRAPSLLLLGLLYGWLSWRTGSIWPAVVAHGVNNGLASALALLARPDGAPSGEPALSDALVAVAVGVAALGAAVSIFRALVPAAAAPAGLPLADTGDPSTRFRPARVPGPLVWVVVAGWASLGAILLSGR